ncbi:hypothetical protein SMACR_07148 [Sordaria macrospora]|uniref:Asl1-like glycosyl hydrolase catalytic domain-containing protein n=1 Tax=Sordaria macrospora TaxID=5147 RepID=A0A8S8ZF83_SORMA|nr:hypothetical protein SMACR_07148 [Sordaria macrospora]KAH7626042.1 hypothetical protein B0T09DRAFT_48914 [Sordaria sp. MPI-SDFR-AT-0083]WPJ61219.1 hypothetical protein SMAC4_07148 [Sordaria macrospora]
MSKRGLTFPVSSPDPPFLFSKPGSLVSWLYNWSPRLTPGTGPGCSLHFVPMQWNHVYIDELPGHLNACYPDPDPECNGQPTILGFNEPELPDQSNMDVALAAAEWLRVIEPLRRQGVRAGSPGISSAPQGVTWLREFMEAIRSQGSDVDFYCLHWYGGANLGGFYDYIWSTHHQLGPDKPVWITEFACTNWNQEDPIPKEEVENFCRESCKYLDTLDWVERYAWFGAMRPETIGNVGRWAAFLGDEGELTELGAWYRDCAE